LAMIRMKIIKIDIPILSKKCSPCLFRKKSFSCGTTPYEGLILDKKVLL